PRAHRCSRWRRSCRRGTGRSPRSAASTSSAAPMRPRTPSAPRARSDASPTVLPAVVLLGGLRQLVQGLTGVNVGHQVVVAGGGVVVPQLGVVAVDVAAVVLLTSAHVSSPLCGSAPTRTYSPAPRPGAGSTRWRGCVRPAPRCTGSP